MTQMKISLVFILAFMSTQMLGAISDARLMRYPHICGNQIVFVYGGDIWTVDADGGEARRLTSHKGLELFPRISPDGQWVAFSAEYNGARQIYVMPAQGGTPRQLTWYNDVGPMEPRNGFDNVVLDWTSDSEHILFRSNRTPYSKLRSNYFLVNINGGLEEPLPIPNGGFAVLSPDNTKIAFTWPDNEFRNWKRYQGGRASNIWVYDLECNMSEQITDFKGTDHIPVWYKEKIYFASDRDLFLNIYSYDINTRKTSQVTFHKDFDVMWPAGNNGQLVYESGGRLFKINLETEAVEQVVVHLNFDYGNSLSYIKNVKDNIHSMEISPSGKRVLFDARGDIFSLPVGEGTIQNLTNTQGIREIYPKWSPNGKWIAYYSDATGEYEVYILENKEYAKPRQLTFNSTGWKFPAEWSPDSRYLVFFDRSMHLKILDTESGHMTFIDTPTSEEIKHYSFSPDSKWITYSKKGPNGLGNIWVYNIRTGIKTQLTDDTYSDSHPLFSKDGQYLFFLSMRDFNLTFSDYELDYLYNNATRIYALHLTKESPRLFQPTEIAEDSGNSSNNHLQKNNTQVKIDLNDVNQRILALPMPAGNYQIFDVVDDGLIFLSGDSIMYKYHYKEHKNDVILERISSGVVSSDGNKVLYVYNGEYGVASLAPGQRANIFKLNLDDMIMRIDPRKEWEQIFADGWRIYRDYFYVSNMHNVDWKGIRERYATLLPYLNHRFDLDYILSEMVAETNTGHSYVFYGDFERVKRIQTGLLGAELKADNKHQRYIINKIYEGENWNSATRSPLVAQGIDIQEGEYLISINGHDVTTSKNPYSFLENRVNKATRISVNNKPSSEGARTYTIWPIGSEFELKYLDWVKSRRSIVEKLSNGRIGYIHVPNTAIDGMRELHKGMYAYHHKDALIIDDRYNSGGMVPERMIELLSRKTLAYWHGAGLDPMITPGIAHNGPKAMLINQYSSSGGDAFPYFFRQKNLGMIIGSRTWGGLVGMSTNPTLVDGGYIRIPRFGIYNQNGEWIIEGIGVYPDIEIVDTPHEVAQGKDPSLEKAIEVLMEELENNLPLKWKTPADPDRSGWIETKVK